jgi:hypothetical protein
METKGTQHEVEPYFADRVRKILRPPWCGHRHASCGRRDPNELGSGSAGLEQRVRRLEKDERADGVDLHFRMSAG